MRRRMWMGALACMLGATLVAGQTTGTAGSMRAFTGMRVIDPASGSPIDNAALVVGDGRVAALGPASRVQVPAGTPTTRLDGKVVVPGLISAHVHISDVQGIAPRAYTRENTMRQLGVFARYGISTVWSLGGEQAPAFEARDAQNTPGLDRTRLYLSGEVITGATPDEARQKVAAVAALKPDVIKIRVDDNLGTAAKMSPEVFRAVIDEAHQRKLRVAAHIFYLDDAKALLRAGVDAIVHSVRDKDIDDEFVGLMKARNIPYCPTLTRELSTFVYESTPAFFADPFFLREADRGLVAQLQEPERQQAVRSSKSAQAYKAALEVAKRNLKKASDAGLLIAMGTDTGPFPERFQGFFEHLEMEMMVAAGLSPARVLRSATIDAARAMGVDGVGTLKPGSWADLVVLQDDPLADIRNTRSIDTVVIAGNLVKR